MIQYSFLLTTPRVHYYIPKNCCLGQQRKETDFFSFDPLIWLLTYTILSMFVTPIDLQNIYRTRAIISRSKIQAIRTEFSEKTSIKPKKWSLKMG